MKLSLWLCCALFLVFSSISSAQDSAYYEIWSIDNLENIGGHTLTYTGDPQIVAGDEGNVIEFDGVGDRLLIDANPIGEAKEFTVELVFWADTYVEANKEPRFVHIQDPDDPDQKRVMIELRVNEQNECYMDGFIKTDTESLPLIDESLTHPTETWLHTAITYKDGVFTTYMEGVKELSGNLSYQDQILGPTGKTSLGARMDERAYFKGKMKTLKVTRAALEPEDFLINQDSVTTKKKIALINSEMIIYPVPADQLIQVEPGIRNGQAYSIQILDALGKELYSDNFPGSERGPVSINTSNFKSGIYLIQIQTASSKDSRSIVIQH